MAKKQTRSTTEEPMGIVISRGNEADLAPTVLAFVWGPIDADISDLIAA